MKNIKFLYIALLILSFIQWAYADYEKSFLISKNFKITSYELNINKRYPLYNMFDSDPDNTFVYNSDKNIRLDVEVNGNEDISCIEIINGYSKNEKLYYANNIIRKIKVLGSGGFVKVYSLNESRSYQKLLLPKPLKKISILVEDIKKGSKYNDTCISSIRFVNSLSKDILSDNSYYLFSAPGNYPEYSLIDKNEGVLKIYKNDMINHDLTPIDFSPDGTKLFFFEGEAVNYGLFVYDFKKRKDKLVLTGKYIKKLKWMNDDKIIIYWMTINGEKRSNGESILSVKDL